MTVLQTSDNKLLRSGNGHRSSPNDFGVVAVGSGRVPLAGNLSATFEAMYESNPYVAAVVNKLARQIATVPIKVYDRPPGVDGPVEVPKHEVAQLLRSPAPRVGTSWLLQRFARSALVHGDGLSSKFRETEAAKPTALLPVSWPHVAAYAPQGRGVAWWSTFETGQQRFFSARDSLHLAWESQNLNGLGVSPLTQLAGTLRIDDAAERYATANFANGARPAGAIVPPAEFQYQEGQREQLRAELKAMHEGVDNAGSLALLAPGFDWKPFSHSAVEADLMAIRQFSREAVCSAYDVPGPMVNDLTRATFSNITELHRLLYVTVLRPWFALIEEVLQRQLIDDEPEWAGRDMFVAFDLSEVLRGDRRSEIDAAAEAFKAGLMTLNEARAFLEMAPVNHPLADVPHVPSNNNTALGYGDAKTDNLPDATPVAIAGGDSQRVIAPPKNPGEDQ